MDTGRALRVLGLDTTASWEEIRGAYRRLMRAHHPDVAAAGPAARATEITEAFATLDRETGQGRRPLSGTGPGRSPAPQPRRGRGAEAAVPSTTVTLDVGDADVVDALGLAAQALGRVGPIDRESGILVVTLGPPRFAPSQLLAEVGSAGGRTTVEFTLESLGHELPPSIDAVVAELARNLRRS